MGATHVTVTIRNPAQPEKTWEALFLVDTGATDCMAPRKHLEAIGLAPRGRRTYELADGASWRLTSRLRKLSSWAIEPEVLSL